MIISYLRSVASGEGQFPVPPRWPQCLEGIGFDH